MLYSLSILTICLIAAVIQRPLETAARSSDRIAMAVSEREQGLGSRVLESGWSADDSRQQTQCAFLSGQNFGVSDAVTFACEKGDPTEI